MLNKNLLLWYEWEESEGRDTAMQDIQNQVM